MGNIMVNSGIFSSFSGFGSVYIGNRGYETTYLVTCKYLILLLLILLSQLFQSLKPKKLSLKILGKSKMTHLKTQCLSSYNKPIKRPITANIKLVPACITNTKALWPI